MVKISFKPQPPTPERTVHEVLSRHQAAYAVFVPKPDDFFNLFEIIFVHCDRSWSPRNTNTNLREIFEYLEDGDLPGPDKALAEAFLKQFQKVCHRTISRNPEVTTVSEKSLRRAGLAITTPVASLNSRASKSSSMYRQLRLTWVSSDAYTGRKKLQKLIWEHAEEVFLLILQELDGRYFSAEIGNRNLMGIVTKRLINEVGVSRVDENGAAVYVTVVSGAVSGDVGVTVGADSTKVKREVYDDLYGVSGLHFIAFPVECLEKHRWRFYRGIDVCDSELDENASPDLLRSDDFFQAGLWLHGVESTYSTAACDHKTVVEESSIISEGSTEDTYLHDLRTGEDRDHVDITNIQTMPFVDIDIRPFMSEFASNQCKLAAYYRKLEQVSDSGKNARAVFILRSALRKCCFESTIRALYDLSTCYLLGICVHRDNNMARLLRYCASGLRRSYSSRCWWLGRLVLEIGFRNDDVPERSIGTMALLSCWRPLGGQEDNRNYGTREESKNDVFSVRFDSPCVATEPMFDSFTNYDKDSSCNAKKRSMAGVSYLSDRYFPRPHPIVRTAQDLVYDVDKTQTMQENLQQVVTGSEYRNSFGFAVSARLVPVLTDLENNKSLLRLVISQNDTLSSIKKQISTHKPIFERKGYPAWSRDIIGTGRQYRNHSWCQLVFQGALASTEESMRWDEMPRFNEYTKIQHALDIRAIEDLQDYIHVLKSLDQIYERVCRYGMCSTEYQVTIRSGFTGRDIQTITAGPHGCRMSEGVVNSFKSRRAVPEVVVWPPPATGHQLPRSNQIVELNVARAIAASKFQDLKLRDVEDLELHKLKNDDLRLLLNTTRFANGAELLAHKFYLGNHVTDGFMSNLARYWLLGSAEGNEDAFRHLLLLPDRTSIDLVRVMMAAVNLCREDPDQVRSLCWEISTKKEVWDCCNAIAHASVPSGIVARARLCIACLEPGMFSAVRTATRMSCEGPAGQDLKDNSEASEELMIMLRITETVTWKPKLAAYVQSKKLDQQIIR